MMNDKIRQAQDHHERGNQFDDAGDTARAMDEWKLAIQLNPKHFEAHYNLGSAYADTSNLDAAVAEMEIAFGLEPDDRDTRRELVQMLLERGDAFIAQKDTEHAIEDWQAVLEFEPGNALAHFKLGQTYKEKLDDERAATHLTVAIESNHLFTDAYDQLAEILVAQNRTREAITLLWRAVRASMPKSFAGFTVDPSLLGGPPRLEIFQPDTNFSDLARDLAELELDAGNPDQAMAALELAVPEPEDAGQWRAIAQALEERGDAESAEIARNRAIELEQGEFEENEPTNESTKPNLAEMHYTRAEELYEAGRYDDAFAEYEQAVELNPEHAGAHYGMGVIYQQDEEYKLAEEEYRETLRLDPNHADAHFSMGQIFVERKDWQNAIQEYREVLRIAPNDVEAREGLIWGYLVTNALGDVQSELARGGLKAESAGELWEELGKAYEERNAHANAIAAYERALGLNKKLKDAREGLKRLRG